MGFALLSLIPGIVSTLGKIVGGDKGKKMEEVGGLINEVKGQYEFGNLSPEQQIALQTALMAHEEKIKEIALEEYKAEIEDLKSQRDAIKTEIISGDPYVRRARPTFLWLMYLVLLINFVIFPILGHPIVELPTALYYLFGSAFLGYSAFRTIDKSQNGLKGITNNAQNLFGIGNKK